MMIEHVMDVKNTRFGVIYEVFGKGIYFGQWWGSEYWDNYNLAPNSYGFLSIFYQSNYKWAIYKKIYFKTESDLVLAKLLAQ